MILEQQVALISQHRLNGSREHPEQTRKKDLHSNAAFLDINGRLDGIAKSGNSQVKLISRPAGLDMSTARDVFVKTMDIVGNPAPRLVPAEVVGEIDFDGL